MTKGERAQAAEKALLSVKESYGILGEIHGSSSECFEIIENEAHNGPVIVYDWKGTLITCRQIVTDVMLEEYTQTQATYDKYEDYL